MKTISGYVIGIFAIVLLAAFATGCGENVEYDEQPRSESAPGSDTGADANVAAAPASDQTGVFSGVVTETMNGGGYTYVLIDTDDGQRWVAGSEMSVAVGDRVTVSGVILMRDFSSSSLDRTFAEIWFAQSIRTGDISATTPASDEFDHSRGIGSAHVSVDKEVIADITVPAGGHAIATLYAEKEALAGQEITVRGQVVKYTAEVMGSNWLHIQDGSGEGETADLTVTTAARVEVGDVVLVCGKLALDRDFGYGYRYALLIEDAEVTVE